MTDMQPKSRTAVLNAAFEVLSAKPAATLAEIAIQANVGRATLHRHFRSREELLDALTRQAIEELNAAVEEATRDAHSHSEGLRLMLEAVIPLGARHWFLVFDPAEHEPDISELLRRVQEALRVEIDLARGEGLFDADMPTEWIVQAIDGLIYAAWTMIRREEATSKQAAALAWRTLTGAMH
ncbi:MAG: helix-turn-helix domain-containing protein [Pseudomonadota bacterium]